MRNDDRVAPEATNNQAKTQTNLKIEKVIFTDSEAQRKHHDETDQGYYYEDDDFDGTGAIMWGFISFIVVIVISIILLIVR